MESYCLMCTKNTENTNPSVSSTSNGKAIILSNCVICGSKNPDLLKTKKQKGLLSKLGIKKPLSKVPILGNILLSMRIK